MIALVAVVSGGEESTVRPPVTAAEAGASFILFPERRCGCVTTTDDKAAVDIEFNEEAPVIAPGDGLTETGASSQHKRRRRLTSN